MVLKKYFTTLLLLYCISNVFAQPDSSFWNKQFVQLSIIIKDTVIFNPCDAANRTLFISRDSVFDNQGQEQVALKILNAHYIDNSWLLKTSLADYTLVYYNEATGIAKWSLKYKQVKYPVKILFIQKAKSDRFKIINQPCKECWDSDCDEANNKPK